MTASESPLRLERRSAAVPFFSVCIPQYGRTSFLIEVCRSLDAQRFRAFEVCISDDCSPDGREEELLHFLEQSDLAYAYRRREVNGRYDANLRSAIDLAIGDYVFLLGNDDALTDADALGTVHRALTEAGPRIDVALTNFQDYLTGRITRRIAARKIGGSGPAVAAAVYRCFSFVSGVVLHRAAALRWRTTAWDGSEMYQMYLGCRIIAAGGRVLGIEQSVIRKDVHIPGEAVDSYSKRPKVHERGMPMRPLPVDQLVRLVLDAVTPDGERVPLAIAMNVIAQYYGFLYPYWLLEYRRVQSWRYAVGVARAMRPSRSLAGARAPWAAVMLGRVLFAAATTIGLTVPAQSSAWLLNPARRVARLVAQLGAADSNA